MNRAKFFDMHRDRGEALSLNDFTLGTGYADIPIPDDVSLATQFSRNVSLNAPLASAAMDTVTTAPLAIGLARAGGIGIIHRNLSPKDQAEEVQRVKYFSITGLISYPVWVFEDETIGEVLRRREEKRYSFHSFLVVDREKKQLVGVFTRQDLAMCDSHALPIAAVMTKKPVTAPAHTSVYDAHAKMKEHKVKLLPLVDERGGIAGLYTWRDTRLAIGSSKFPDNVGPDGRLRVAAAIGVLVPHTDTEERIAALVDKHVDVFVIDMAHGDSRAVMETVRWLKLTYPSIDVVAGNVSEGDSVKRLLDAGADGVRVGQGPGSTCTTGLVTGTGVPLATAIDQCASAAGWRGGAPIGADGGMQYSGDIVKALASGASYAVIGRMFAGTDEAPGEIVRWEGGLWKEYRGMGSLGAMVTRSGSRERYEQETVAEEDLVPEGIEGRVPYVGPLRRVVAQLVGGVRKGMFNVGASSIEELRDKAVFYRFSATGRAQSHPSILITKQAPNYNVEMRSAA